jgi:hypothetical protein
LQRGVLARDRHEYIKQYRQRSTPETGTAMADVPLPVIFVDAGHPTEWLFRILQVQGENVRFNWYHEHKPYRGLGSEKEAGITRNKDDGSFTFEYEYLINKFRVTMKDDYSSASVLDTNASSSEPQTYVPATKLQSLLDTKAETVTVSDWDSLEFKHVTNGRLQLSKNDPTSTLKAGHLLEQADEFVFYGLRREQTNKVLEALKTRDEVMLRFRESDLYFTKDEIINTEQVVRAVEEERDSAPVDQIDSLNSKVEELQADLKRAQSDVLGGTTEVVLGSEAEVTATPNGLSYNDQPIVAIEQDGKTTFFPTSSEKFTPGSTLRVAAVFPPGSSEGAAASKSTIRRSMRRAFSSKGVGPTILFPVSPPEGRAPSATIIKGGESPAGFGDLSGITYRGSSTTPVGDFDLPDFAKLSDAELSVIALMKRKGLFFVEDEYGATHAEDVDGNKFALTSDHKNALALKCFRTGAPMLRRYAATSGYGLTFTEQLALTEQHKSLDDYLKYRLRHDSDLMAAVNAYIPASLDFLVAKYLRGKVALRAVAARVADELGMQSTANLMQRYHSTFGFLHAAQSADRSAQAEVLKAAESPLYPI